MTHADLLRALRDCYDPTLKRNIVDGGLIRSVTLTPDPEAPGANIPGVPPRFTATIHLFAPATDEAANTMLITQIENRLAGLEQISSTQINLLPTPFPILR